MESVPADKAPARKRRRSLIRLVLLVVVPVIALVIAGVFYLTGGRYVGTDDAFTKADTVPVSADVSARVVAIEVHDNEQVTQGQVLFRLDDETFRLALAKAESKLTQTRNDISALQANYRQKQADMLAAKAQLSFAQKRIRPPGGTRVPGLCREIQARRYQARPRHGAPAGQRRPAGDRCHRRPARRRSGEAGRTTGSLSPGCRRARPGGARSAPHGRDRAFRRAPSARCRACRSACI